MKKDLLFFSFINTTGKKLHKLRVNNIVKLIAKKNKATIYCSNINKHVNKPFINVNVKEQYILSQHSALKRDMQAKLI